MRAVVQRVSSASVEVGEELVGSIDRGILVYLAAAPGDEARDVSYMARKLVGLRVFNDPEGKMSLSVKDVAGELLVVSQFTLFGDVRRGRRPSFTGAAPPEEAERLYEALIKELRVTGLRVETGRFRAMMDVHATVAGPVTILIDSRKLF